jgi:hypothetical protein
MRKCELRKSRNGFDRNPKWKEPTLLARIWEERSGTSSFRLAAGSRSFLDRGKTPTRFSGSICRFARIEKARRLAEV